MASEDASDAALAAKIEALQEQVKQRGRETVTFKLDPLDADLQAVVDAGANHGQELNTLLLLQIIRLLRTKEPPK